MTVEFKGKLVLVTGAARGIGKGVATEYAREGARVILLDILGDKLDETVTELGEAGHTAYGFKCDLGSSEEIANLGADIIKDIGVPDIIHNNAFWAPSGSVEDIEIDVVERAFNISVLGYLRIIKSFLTPMIERKSGWIVNTASPNGITPSSWYAHHGLTYNICKAGDISMSQALVSGLKKYNIGVSVVYPGAVLTEAVLGEQGNSSDEFKQGILKKFMEVATTPEVAAKAFLAQIREGRFLVSNYPNFENILVEYAKAGLDPTAVNIGQSV
jgi:NAD(P)-dependent dehydrogenase (short-subunit alcohol dehydrogenase family)